MLYILGYPGEHTRNSHEKNTLIHPVNTVRFQYVESIMQTMRELNKRVSQKERVESRQGVHTLQPKGP